MDTSKKSSYSALFWGLTAGAAIGLLGSAYYLYTLFSGDEDLAEEDMQQLQELKDAVEESNGGAMNVETAIQIMAMSNRISEEIMKKQKPDLDDRRRAAIDNNDEYERLCQEVFEAKEYAYNQAISKVIGQFGNVNMEEIHKLMSQVPPLEMERINHKYDKQTFDNVPVPEKKLTKEAFAYYGKKFEEEMKEFQKMMSQQTAYNPNQDQYFFFRLLMIKMKVDDLLYLKYKYTEPQIKYMLFEYNLFEDPEVKRINEKLMRFDNMFGGMQMGE